jgi:hypothetical protein
MRGISGISGMSGISGISGMSGISGISGYAAIDSEFTNKSVILVCQTCVGEVD